MADPETLDQVGVAAGGSGSDPEAAGEKKGFGADRRTDGHPQAVSLGRKPDGRRRQEFRFRSWRCKSTEKCLPELFECENIPLLHRWRSVFLQLADQ